MSWLSQIGTDIANVWNEQPNWAKGLEIGGVGALATGGLAAGLGLFDAAGAGAAGAGIDAFPTIGPGVAATDAAGSGSALGFAGDVGGAAATDPSLFATTGLAGDVSGGAALPSTGFPATGFPAAAPGGLPGAAPAVDLSGGAGGAFQTVGDVTNVGGADITGGTFQTLDAPGATSSSGILSTLGSAAKNVAPVAGVAGLGYNLYSGYQTKQQLNALANQEQQASALVAQNAATANAAAGPALSQGETLQSYLQTGTLPANIQSQVTQQVEAAKAQIIQGYASRGMSTDPNQNSALAQDLANVGTQAQTLMGNLETQLQQAGTQMVQTANSLLQTGINATQVCARLPIAMQNLNIQLAQATSTAIASFASALNSGGVGGGQKFQLTPA